MNSRLMERLRKPKKFRLFKHRRARPLSLLLLAGCLLAAGLFLWLYHPLTPTSYYKKQLGILHKTVGKIGPAVELSDGVPKDINANLKAYDGLLEEVIDLCRPLVAKDNKYTTQNSDKSLQEIIDNSQRLCSDLSPVAIYSRSVYKASGPFINYTPNLLAVDHNDYQTSLNKITVINSKTSEDLRQVDNSLVKDPGLTELIGHLDDVNKQIILIKASLEYRDYDGASLQSSQLAKLLRDDKIHFLSARGYYWNNTIGIEQLLPAIQKLENQIQNSGR